MKPSAPATAALTVLALVAFASNSLLTRLALGSHEIDAATFTWLRLAAGAVTLAVIVRRRAGGWSFLRQRGALGPMALFAYAAPFSFAYLRIGAAVGALVLFGVVQLTMITWGWRRGERPTLRAWAGVLLSTGGLVALTVPAATRPDPVGIALMTIAGVAWGAYSLAGQGAADPLATNARSFLLSAPLAMVLSLVVSGHPTASRNGLVLAIVSGAVTSGLGYVLWYRALRGLSATHAAVVQLAVPVIAALGAVAFLNESLSARLVASGITVTSGIGLVLAGRQTRPALDSGATAPD